MSSIPGDRIVARPDVVTNHAITIAAPPESVWPWLTRMPRRARRYTARWVDRLLFPAGWPSASRLIPELQDISSAHFIPDGSPETGCSTNHRETGPRSSPCLALNDSRAGKLADQVQRCPGLVLDIQPYSAG